MNRLHARRTQSHCAPAGIRWIHGATAVHEGGDEGDGALSRREQGGKGEGD